jgi:DNA polymerase-1
LGDTRIVGTIHDELLLEVSESKAEAIAVLLGEIMRRIGSRLLFPVPVDAEVSISEAWGDD